MRTNSILFLISALLVLAGCSQASEQEISEAPETSVSVGEALDIDEPVIVDELITSDIADETIEPSATCP
jgi:uncharacterized lipoprotein YajG